MAKRLSWGRLAQQLNELAYGTTRHAGARR
jgi:hypothetical protein